MESENSESLVWNFLETIFQNGKPGRKIKMNNQSRREYYLSLWAVVLLLAAGSMFKFKKETHDASADSREPVDYVDPFIGTGGHGHVYPGATMPFGMVQVSPDNGHSGWDYCSGYNYRDSLIAGFSMTHLSGTGIGDLADISFMPVIWNPGISKGIIRNFHLDDTARFSHDNEHAEPGYYAVVLNNNDIKVELTAAERAGFYRYTFPKSANATVVLNLGFAINWDHPANTQIHVLNNSTIEGYRMSTGWAKHQKVYFFAKFSKPFKEALLKHKELRFGEKSVNGNSVMGLFTFDARDGKPVLQKVGISAVSIEGARKNLQKEIPGWKFDAVRMAAHNAWAREMNKIKVSGASDAHKRIFYTAMYHSMLAPTIFSDVDGGYLGADGKNHVAKGFTNYTTFSLWDTYRSENPLFTLVQRNRVNDMIKTMLAFYEQHGFLPVWPLVGNETNTMIGYHAVPVIVDAYLKGFRGYDVQEAYKAIVKSATVDNDNDVEMFNKYGYVPCDEATESVSKTLEYAYDDWCIAQMAKALGKKKDYTLYLKRSGYYKNLFDPSVQFMRPKLSSGKWLTPFDPLASPSNFKKRNYTEANAWQYLWYVPQNVENLIKLFGGDAAFANKLDKLFTTKAKTQGKIADMSGMIGQYVQGNEPDLQTPYLYDYAGEPWKTQAIVRKILEANYKDAPDGLPGNEDCGEMSAWEIFSALGFYPVNPADGTFEIGSPLFQEAVIKVGQGKKFSIEAENVSTENKYIQSAELNGKPFDKAFITYREIMNGGVLRFQMGPEPNKSWASSKDARPPSDQIAD